MAKSIRRGLTNLLGVAVCLAVGGLATLFMVAQWLGPLLMHILN